MSRSALPSTIEMAFAGKTIARLGLEQCELLIGSEYGVILQPLRMVTRSFEPILRQVDPGLESIAPEILDALDVHQSIELFGSQGSEELLRSLPRHIAMRHGSVYLAQADEFEDLLQCLFEEFYQVPADVKASRAEIREGLSDRQALILLNHPTLSASEIEQLCQILPASLLVVASTERRFFWADCAIEVASQTTSEDSLAGRNLVLKTLQDCVQQRQWAEVLRIARSTEQDFAVTKFWGAWEQVLRFGLQAAWGLEDEVTEAWALHQLGTLAFCQEQVTLGYDLLKEALDLRTAIGEQTAIAFSQHNLSQLKALIVPM